MVRQAANPMAGLVLKANTATPIILGMMAKYVHEIGILADFRKRNANVIKLIPNESRVAHAEPAIPYRGISTKLAPMFVTADNIAAIIDIYVVDVAFDRAE